MENSKTNIHKIKVFIFMASTVYAILSAMKIKEGMAGKSLIASYEYAVSTDILYSFVIAIAVTIVSFFISNKLDRHNNEKCIEYFDSYLFILLLISYVIDGTIENVWYCSMYCTSILLAVTYTFILSKRRNVDRKSLSWQDWKEIGLPLSVWFLPVGIFIPIELYINNLGDFEFEFWHYFLVLVVCTIGVVLGTTIICVLLLDKKQLLIISLVLFSFSVIGYIQGVVLNRSLKVLDGDIQKWGVGLQIVNAAIWIVGFL